MYLHFATERHNTDSVAQRCRNKVFLSRVSGYTYIRRSVHVTSNAYVVPSTRTYWDDILYDGIDADLV